ncbi:MAG: EAL domain-containing protein, partial [Lachnospiraceae bacterium]|nr:EAL domain-containing protein [Lachnospiraceae bacterium]
KVDIKFLQDEAFNGKGEKVLTSVIRMAKWLHLPAIVEGVETVEQVDFLKCVGCEYVQGYYYAKPMPIADYEDFIAQEEDMGAKRSVSENAAIVNELWNTRSSVSIFFDLLDMPIAVYEYRNGNLEVLRTNTRYENDIMFDKGVNEFEHDRRIEEEKDLLREAFEKIMKGDYCGPMEYELTEDIWYRVTVKVIGKRADTMIMMVTFYDISDNKL